MGWHELSRRLEIRFFWFWVTPSGPQRLLLTQNLFLAGSGGHMEGRDQFWTGCVEGKWMPYPLCYCSGSVLGPRQVAFRGYCWHCTQKWLLAGSGDHIGCQGLTLGQPCARQMPCPLCYLSLWLHNFNYIFLHNKWSSRIMPREYKNYSSITVRTR